VDPVPDKAHRELSPDLPGYVRRYYETNRVRTFSFSRPFKKLKTGNEFLDLWTYKTTLETVDGYVCVYVCMYVPVRDRERQTDRNSVCLCEGKSV
jgi:hypothetical protein